MKNTICTILFTAAALIGSCTDDNSVTPTPISDIYFPLSTGSTWTYEISGGGKATRSKDSVTGTNIANGIQYHDIFITISNPANPYSYTESYRKSNDTLYLLNGKTDNIVLIAKNNAVWTSSASNDTFSQNDTSTVVESGISHTVNGTAYNNVFHVRQVRTVLLQGKATVTEFNIYYAKNIGLIEQINPGSTVRLTSYSIK